MKEEDKQFNKEWDAEWRDGWLKCADTESTPEFIKRVDERCRNFESKKLVDSEEPVGRYGLTTALIQSGREVKVQSDNKKLTQPAHSMGLQYIGNKTEFSTSTTSVRLTEGKWMYEITLLSPGLQQIGWAVQGAAATWTREYGVGDSLNTYSFDGSRVKKWNVVEETYGSTWEVGDVITSFIDLTNGIIEYSANGQLQGKAFTKIDTTSTLLHDGRRAAESLVFTPAFSLSNNEACVVNFGAMPFKYPISGYSALQLGVPRFIEQLKPMLSGIQYFCGMSSSRSSAAVMVIFKHVFSVVEKYKPVFATPGRAQHLQSFIGHLWIPFLISNMSNLSFINSVVNLSHICLDTKTYTALWRGALSLLCVTSSHAHHFRVQDYPTVYPCDRVPPTVVDDKDLWPKISYLVRRPEKQSPPRERARSTIISTLDDKNKLIPDCSKSQQSQPPQELKSSNNWSGPEGDSKKHLQPEAQAATNISENYAFTETPIKFEPDSSLKLLEILSTCGDQILLAWLDSPDFSDDLLRLCQHKQPCSSVLRLLIKHMWWVGADSMNKKTSQSVNKMESMSAEKLCEDIDQLAEELIRPTDKIRENIIQKLLMDDDGELRGRTKLLSVIEKYCASEIQRSPSDSAGFAKLFLLILPILMPAVIEVPEVYPTSNIIGIAVDWKRYTSTADHYLTIDRLGGLLSHLQAEHPEVSFSDSGSSSGDLSDRRRRIHSQTFSKLLMFYFYGAKLHINRIMNGLITKTKVVAKFHGVLNDAQQSASSAEAPFRCIVAEAAETTRKCIWKHISITSSMKSLRYFNKILLKIFMHYSETPYFSFLPNFMLEALVTCIHLRSRLSETDNSVEDDALPFLITHLRDSRIVRSDLKDTMLGAVASLLETSNSSAVGRLMNADTPLMSVLISSIFKSFHDKQTWVTSLIVLIQIGKTLAFCRDDTQELVTQIEWEVIPSTTAQMCSSQKLSKELCACWGVCCEEMLRNQSLTSLTSPITLNVTKEILEQKPDKCDSIFEFIKELFNRLGWATSELSLCQQEQPSHPIPGQRIIRQLQHRKKCGMMCDLSRRLFDVLEVTSTMMPFLYSEVPTMTPEIRQRSNTNMRMLVESLVHMLNNYSSHECSSKFGHRVQVRLLAPVAGCLVSLLYYTPTAINEPLSETVSAISVDNSFLKHLSTTNNDWSIETFKYLINIDWVCGMP